MVQEIGDRTSFRSVVTISLHYFTNHGFYKHHQDRTCSKKRKNRRNQRLTSQAPETSSRRFLIHRFPHITLD